MITSRSVIQFDHCKGDPPNIIGNALQVDDSGFVIGTEVGQLIGK